MLHGATAHIAYQAALEELVTHKYGHRLLLHLIAPSHLPPHVVAHLQPPLPPEAPGAIEAVCHAFAFGT